MYPEHILSLGVTTIGLLALTIYAAIYTVRSTATNTFEPNFRKVGAIITLLGLYFLLNYVSWLFLGTDAKWSTWYAWLLGHNMDLWLLSLPVVGIPLMFTDRLMNRAGKQSTVLYAIESAGAIFMGLFVAVYVAGIGRLPDYVVYHSEPTIRLIMSIIGALLVALIILAFIIGLFMKRKE